MKIPKPSIMLMLSFFILSLSSCSSVSSKSLPTEPKKPLPSYESRLPQRIASTENTLLVDPRVHAWGAYSNGTLIRAGLAVSGADYCPDIKRGCRTGTGTFRIQSLGSVGCKSSIYPLPKGGAPMPYCMFFNGGQGFHGTAENKLAEANLSHGCVRLHTSDAEWIRFNFAKIGTKVIVKPY